MDTQTKIGEIYALLPKIALEVGPIEKDQTMEGSRRYSYRGIDNVMNRVGPILSKHGIHMRSEILAHERFEAESRSGGTLFYCRLHVRYHLVASDGSSVWTEAMGEAMDSGDKAANKAMSAALKYAICQALTIPVGMDDSDNENHEVASSKNGEPATQSQVGYAAKIIREKYPTMTEAARENLKNRIGWDGLFDSLSPTISKITKSQCSTLINDLK